MYKDGEPLYLDAETNLLAEIEQDKRRPANELCGVIRAWADLPISSDHYELDRFCRQSREIPVGESGVIRDRICAATVWEECLGQELPKLATAKRKEIIRAINDLTEWSSMETRKLLVGSDLGRQMCYMRSQVRPV